MTRNAALSMPLAVLAAVMLVPSAASAQANCKWYGATALKQQQQNEQMKCGFSGPEWSTDMARHQVWCGSVPPDVWKAAAQKRDQMLAECGKKKG